MHVFGRRHVFTAFLYNPNLSTTVSVCYHEAYIIVPSSILHEVLTQLRSHVAYHVPTSLRFSGYYNCLHNNVNNPYRIVINKYPSGRFFNVTFPTA